MDSSADADSATLRSHRAAWRRLAEILTAEALLPALMSSSSATKVLGLEEFTEAGDGGVGHGAHGAGAVEDECDFGFHRGVC